MIKYIITHCKHEGCYDFTCFEDNSSRMRVTSIKINPPKIFLFEKKLQAMEFFNDYINDVDCIDVRCRKGNEVEHIDHCTCGIIELDDEDNPILFYNKTNQIFFLEIGAQTFMTSQDLQIDILNMNLTNKLIRKCRRLDKEQKKKYVELGEVCKECLEEEEQENNNIHDKVSDTEE